MDENVQVSAGEFLASRGYEVRYSRDLLFESAPDMLLITAALFEGFVVVTHDRDFRRLSKLIPHGYRTRAQHQWGRISLRVPETRATHYLAQFLPEIEFHYRLAVERHDRFLMTITRSGCQVTRGDLTGT
jgi:hypothetical protein